ncbi:MAG: hypothetical protein QXT45_06320 [Candidatus Bilamarchaeaceae archaeon]
MIKKSLYTTNIGHKYIKFEDGNEANQYRLYFSKQFTDIYKEDSPLSVKFPVKGNIENALGGRSGRDYIIKKGEHYIYVVEVISGHRGSADISNVEGGNIVIKGKSYYNGLREIAWAVVVSDKDVVVNGKISGERIDSGDIRTVYKTDGSVTDDFEYVLDD